VLDGSQPERQPAAPDVDAPAAKDEPTAATS
jgi:hypothetical protein